MFDLSQTIDSRESYIPRDGSTNGYLSGNTVEMAGGDINLLLKSIKINNDDMYKLVNDYFFNAPIVQWNKKHLISRELGFF